MTLPAVSWVIDGLDTPLQGWSAGTTAFGGMSQMRGVIRESDARRYPSTVGQGSIVTGYTQGGVVVYQGRLSAPPAIRGGLASFAAQGESVRAAKRATRLLYQNREFSKLTDSVSGPHFDTSATPSKIHLQINDGGLLFTLEPGGSDLGVGGYAGAVFWAPSSVVTRVAYDCVSSFVDANFKIELYSKVGPGVSGMTLRDLPGLGSTSFSRDASWGGTDDEILLILVWRGGAPVALGSGHVLIKNLRINGIQWTGEADTLWSWQLFQDVGARLGFDISGVVAGGPNVLPLDWTSGSWAELLSYIATITDDVWGVVEDRGNGPVLEYKHWGTKEWTVYQADGATVDLTPLELYNQVTVKYVDVGGAPREVTVVADPDPLYQRGTPGSNIVNVWEESLADVQPDSTLATAVANNLLPRVSTLREQGRINAVKAYDHTGREAVREIRAGDTIRVADRDMNTATTHRVFETDQDSEGVACGIETGVSIASLLGRAGLVSARAPSTAELPEMEIEAVGVGGEPAPSALRQDWYALFGSPDRGLPDKRVPGGQGGKKGGRTGGLGKKGRKLY